jgi:beta-glucosidase-like glycosyl hydrolase
MSMKNPYQFIIPRLNGDEIKADFNYYRSLVRKGVAGFIIFGGKLEQIRAYVRKLQDEADLPLIISSDLERGLGQQITGGTSFPPAMAIASSMRDRRKSSDNSRRDKAIGRAKLKLLRSSFRAVAEEAGYAGINTIFAPVLDINTNPENPIISARAFGEDSETVSFFGCEMIRAIQKEGVAACAKHFPGHGDTSVDSHIKLPVITKGLPQLVRSELRPFRKAAETGVRMIMLGHLKVPAIDPSGLPASISKRAVEYLRKNMRYSGLLITDAMNMGGLAGHSEEEACLMALRSGVDLLLHPSDPDKIAQYLEKKAGGFDADRLISFRCGLRKTLPSDRPDFLEHAEISRDLTRRALRVQGTFEAKKVPFLIIINDEDEDRGRPLIKKLKELLPESRHLVMRQGADLPEGIPPPDTSAIAAIFSDTRAWKGGSSGWLQTTISRLEDAASVFISFGSPYLLDPVKGPVKILAYWDHPSAQEAVAELIGKVITRRH